MSAEIAKQRLRQQLSVELGEAIARALDDPSVLGVLLNPDGQVWVNTFDAMRPLGVSLAPDRAESLLGTIAAMAGLTINRSFPLVEAILPDRGFRVAGAIPPVVTSPIFAIRKPSTRVFPLPDLVADPRQLALLRGALDARRNILISGMTGSGKTTLANSLLHELSERSPDDRIVVLEDTPELRHVAPNAIALATTESVSLARLVRATLRFDPMRIVIGEVRGAEAHDLLKAWNTGHPGGIATLHANGAAAALERLDQLAQEANVPSQARLVQEAIDLVVHLTPRCRISEVLYVKSQPFPELEEIS